MTYIMSDAIALQLALVVNDSHLCDLIPLYINIFVQLGFFLKYIFQGKSIILLPVSV
jgi:hypothetical protein